MSRQFKLYTLFPKEKEIGIGVLSVDKHGEAVFFEGMGERDDKILSTLWGARLVWAESGGIRLSGMEATGAGSRKQTTYQYQEWFLSYEI